MARKARAQAASDPDPSEAALAPSPPRRGGRAKRGTQKQVVGRRSRAARAVHEDGEEIDIDAGLTGQDTDSETDDIDDNIPRARSGRPNNSQAARAAVYDPFVDPSRTQSTKTASTIDVQYFFERTTESSVCKHCRYTPLVSDLLS